MYRRDLLHAKNSPLCEIKTLELLKMQISSTSGRRFCIYIHVALNYLVRRQSSTATLIYYSLMHL